MSSVFCKKIYQCKNADWCARDFNPKSDCPECFEQLTNYDVIGSKTPEELAQFLSLQEYRKVVFDGWLPLCNHVMGAKICHENGCKECWLSWLKSPANVEAQT